MPSSTHQINGAHASALALPLQNLSDAALADASLADDDEALDPVPPLPANRPSTPSRKTQAQRQADLGDLVDEDQDKMVMHTKEGMFLFAGRAHDAKNQVSGIVGGRRAAAAARSIWMLSSNDNPYAEWGLISTSAAMETAGRVIDEAVAAREEEIEACKRRGLSLSVQRSKHPAELEIGFRSPYGYAIAELVLRFDYFVRLVKTLVRKDRMTEAQGRELISGVRRSCRAAFEVAVRFERHLTKPELRLLSRSDFLPLADEEARKRINAAVQAYGEVPRDVFTGKVRPRHSRRRERLSEKELRLLSELSLSADPAAEQDTSALL
ncbi:MAG: PFL_4669 family integrating conjugative element protein [Rhizobacter sp.]